MLRVSGSQAIAIAERCFTPAVRPRLSRWRGYTVGYGALVDPASGERIDDGLCTLFRAPHSYTGEESVELSCHGGRAITARLLRSLVAAGARPAAPGEFTQRAFLNGRLDLAQAEAVADLIRARSDAACRVALRQLEGGLSLHIGELRQELIGVLAAIEASIDFSDEVGDLDYDLCAQRIHRVQRAVQDLIQTVVRGRILREGLQVVLLGRPNVGKSSLLNALLGAQRAIVTPIPGTTRDLLEESVQIEGIPLVLSDTAGLRATEDLVEQIGVERAEAAAERCDVALLILDASAGITPEDRAVLWRLEPLGACRRIVVLNKRDLLDADAADEILLAARSLQMPAGEPAPEIITLSATTGEGLSELQSLLIAPLRESAAGPESMAISLERHRVALERAVELLAEARSTTEAGMPGDFIAIDVRGALDQLGLITGETVTDDIIHRIFQDFCVGK